MLALRASKNGRTWGAWPAARVVARCALGLLGALGGVLGCGATGRTMGPAESSPSSSTAEEEQTAELPPADATAAQTAEQAAEQTTEQTTEQTAASERAHGHHGSTHAAHAMHHRFDGAEGWAAVFDDPARDAWQQPAEVIARVNVRPGMTVADVGAGTGYFLPHLSRAVGPSGRVLARDLEPDMVRYMRERAKKEALANVAVDLAAEHEPKLDDASVDRILIVNTWHHLEARAEYTRHLRRALRPGGAVIVVDYTLDAPEGPPRAHRIAPEVVVSELRAGGLDAERVAAPLPRQFIVVGTERRR